jgi:hypothetical protein
MATWAQRIRLGGFDAMSLNQRIALLIRVIPLSNIQVSGVRSPKDLTRE